MNNFNRNRSDGENRRFSGNRFGGGRSGGFRRDFGPREMHKAVCSECKQECEVPFKPTEGRPVFCKECFQKQREQQDTFKEAA